MPKTRLGFDIGSNSVKIAESSQGEIKLHEIRMPDNMIEDGEIAMPNAFSDFLKKEMKKRNIKKGECALAIPSHQVICRAVTLPQMPIDQLMLNLPYEFSDFIQDDADKFIYDYAMCEPTQEDKEEQRMAMMAAVASKERILQYIKIFAGAGLKLRNLLPSEMALIDLTQKYRKRGEGKPEEYGFVNIGHSSVVITIVKNDRVQASRQLSFGCERMDLAIADQLNVDPFLAGSYKQSNYQNVLSLDVCQNIYQEIAVEILKVVNFYQFNYRNSQLNGIYLAGGGSIIEPLTERIQGMLGLPLFPITELFPHMVEADAAAKGILAMAMVSE